MKMSAFWFCILLLFSKQGVSQRRPMNAEEYLGRELRFLSELTPLQEQWISLEEAVFWHCLCGSTSCNWHRSAKGGPRNKREA